MKKKQEKSWEHLDEYIEKLRDEMKEKYKEEDHDLINVGILARLRQVFCYMFIELSICHPEAFSRVLRKLDIKTNE